jgi:hypothetical protein
MTTRYLTFTALSIYLLISLSYQRSNKLQIFLIFILLSSGALSNYIFLDRLDYSPNKAELDLIDYLSRNNLTNGYADYWDSNVITYLSKERITVLPATISCNKLVPFLWLSCEKWYAINLDQSTSKRYFILINTNIFLKKEDIDIFIKYNQLKDILRFGSYRIYVFDGEAPLVNPNETPPSPMAQNESDSDELVCQSGFYDMENWSNTSTRWMLADGTIVVLSPENRTATLGLNALSFYRNRSLEISSNGVHLARVAVPTGFVNVSVPMHLAKGENTIRLHVLEGCERPCDIKELNNADSRCLSIAVQNVRVT